MHTWNEVLDALSTYQKTVDAARILFDNSQMELGCMLLRDTLLRDRKFMFSQPFIDICKMSALLQYLLRP